MFDIQKKLSVKNINDLVRKEIYGIFENNNPTKNQVRKYKRLGKEWCKDDIYTCARSDFILKIIMPCRVSTPEATEFKNGLGIKQYDITMPKEQSVLTEITKIFASEKILLQHSVLRYKIDFFF